MKSEFQRNSRVMLKPLVSPNGLRLRPNCYCAEATSQQVQRDRASLARSLSGDDNRLVVIVGPCSVHDPEAVYGYVMQMISRTADLTNLSLIFRLPGEKPRTSIGWPGFILNPSLNLNADGGIEEGLWKYRELLLKVVMAGGRVATEMLDPDLLCYFDELLTAAWIGARTVTTPQLRFVASGLAMPVLFKHGLSGEPSDALNAIKVARQPGHTFASLDDNGNKAQFTGSTGNPHSALVLRGGDNGPNYNNEEIIQAAYEGSGKKVLIDCNHANSGKDPKKQPDVAKAVVALRKKGLPICGLLIESYWQTGAQKIEFDGNDSVKSELSVTDGCLGIDETVAVLAEINASLN